MLTKKTVIEKLNITTCIKIISMKKTRYREEGGGVGEVGVGRWVVYLCCNYELHLE